MDSDQDILLIGLSKEEEEEMNTEKSKGKKRQKKKKKIQFEEQGEPEATTSEARAMEPTEKVTELANWVVELKNDRMLEILDELLDEMLADEQCKACRCKPGENLVPGSKLINNLIGLISDNIGYIPCQLFNRNTGCSDGKIHESKYSPKIKLHCCALCWYKGKVINLSHSAKSCKFMKYWQNLSGQTDQENDIYRVLG